MNPVKTVLIVDDDEDFLTSTSTILKRRYDVRTAMSGGECLSEVEANKPDLIVMDVMMNDVTDGLDTAKKLKEDENTREIPIVMLTNVNAHLDIHGEVGNDYYPRERWLDKPVNADKLLAAVEELIGK
jgi:CheY-like chemotaxis protein